MTGIRGAILLDRQLKADTVKLDASGKMTGNLNYDAEEYDIEFPQHPLS